MSGRILKILVLGMLSIGPAPADVSFPSGEFLDPPELIEKRIHGTADFEKLADFPEYTREHRLGTRVGHLTIRTPAGNALCSGFLVATDVFITNHHCVANRKTGGSYPPESYRIYMDYWQDGRKGPVSSGVTKVLQKSRSLDYALLRLSKPLGETYGWLELDQGIPLDSGSVVLIQHPRGRSKEIARQNARVVKVNPGRNTIHYLADTEGGSSGSPVFRRYQETVIALHHAGTSGYNEGILMSSIVPQIRQYLPYPQKEKGTSRDVFQPLLDILQGE